MSREEIEQRLRAVFEAELPYRIERYGLSRVQEIIPDRFFSAASMECRDLYVDGSYYGCISLCQSVAEGLGRFIAKCNGIAVSDKHYRQVEALRDNQPPPLSVSAIAAFGVIRGNPTPDRNDFHHLNDNLEQDVEKLEARARECVEALYVIESEIFAFEIVKDGRIALKQSQYWKLDNGMVEGYVKFS